jgi:enterochelin esterase-like enzyme
MEVRPLAVVPFDKGTRAYRLKRYYRRAELLRDIAEDLVPCDCREMILKLANTYQALAAQESASRH